MGRYDGMDRQKDQRETDIVVDIKCDLKSSEKRKTSLLITLRNKL